MSAGDEGFCRLQGESGLSEYVVDMKWELLSTLAYRGVGSSSICIGEESRESFRSAGAQS